MKEAMPTLAADGFVPLCVPEIRGNEWTYVKESLDTGLVSSVGAYVTKFERVVADFVGTRYGIATVNGTAALHIALLVAGVQTDDEVLTSTLTFIAPANAIRYVGAWPVFIDAEPRFWQMDAEKVTDFLTKGCEWRAGALRNRATGRRVRALLPVHILGHPVDIDALLELARKYELAVIEDATESLGATYRGRQVGHLGDIACLSFNGNKLITTGGGGMIVTDREDWARRAKYLTTQAKEDSVEYVHHKIGFNYRLTNLQAAIGVAQMEQLDSYVSAKRLIAERYGQAFRDLPGITSMPEAEWARSAYWLYTILVEKSDFGSSSRELLHTFEECRVQTRPLWQPLHLSAAHTGAYATDCSVAERLHEQALSLPCSVGLYPEVQNRVIEQVQRSQRAEEK
jgi:perosamine synthetase